MLLSDALIALEDFFLHPIDAFTDAHLKSIAMLS